MALADAVPFAVAHYACDEASGSLLDSINGYDLAEASGSIGAAAGVFNGARDFEAGDSEYAWIADNADLSGGDVKYMIRCWVNLESKSSDQTLCSKLSNSGNPSEYALSYIASSDRFRFAASDGGAAWDATVLADNFGAPSTGTWYLIHVWHDPDANVIGISVDAGTANTAAFSAGLGDTTAPFNIGDFGGLGGAGGAGGADGSGGSFFDGLIDDVVILKGYLLDATERTADYNSGTGVAFADWAGGGGAVVGSGLLKSKKLARLSRVG